MDGNDWRVHQAVLRDERDNERLAACAELVANSLDAMVPLMGRALEHPFAKWSPDDLAQALSEQLESIRAQQQEIGRGPVVLDDLDDVE